MGDPDGSVRLRLDLSYDGTAYAGWARQPGQPTVQGVVEAALATVLRADAQLTVAGRTDAGVHAQGQVAHLDVPAPLWWAARDGVLRRLAGLLPSDVRVRALRETSADFDARFAALSRVYAYRVADAGWGVEPVRRLDTLGHGAPLDERRLAVASGALLGTHDFAAFCRRRAGTTTVRRLLRLDWHRDEAQVLIATVEADAFCHSMVRALVGALLAVGDGRRPTGWPQQVLAAGVREGAVTVAPARGLTLVAVRYPGEHQLAARVAVTRAHRAPDAGPPAVGGASDTPRRQDGPGERGAPAGDSPPGHMSPSELRRHGRAVLDWVADYREGVERLPVLSRAAPGDVRAALPAHPPELGEPFEAVLADVDRIVLPGLTHWQSPNFFAFFPASSSGPAVLGELLSAGLGVQGMAWVTSPACTELETHMLDWLVELLGLPDRFRSAGSGGGVIQDSASSATLVALLAARERATQLRGNLAGLRGQPRLTVYTSSQAHSSVEKAVRIAGLGSQNLRLVDVDESLAMRPDALEALIGADVAAGALPVLVVATVGTTSTTAVDPVRAVAGVCRRRGVWLHVDAAMSGTAAVCPELRWLHGGVELADSYCVNPHKWMLTNFDCDAFYVADRRALVAALSILPEYLRNAATDTGDVIDYRDWQVPLGRRFRALKLWFVIRHYGAEGLRRHVRRHLAWARELAGWVDEHPWFTRLAPTPLQLVTFAHTAGDAATGRVLERVNASGAAYLTHTRVRDRLGIRFSVGATATERRHVVAAWQLIARTASEATGL